MTEQELLSFYRVYKYMIDNNLDIVNSYSIDLKLSQAEEIEVFKRLKSIFPSSFSYKDDKLITDKANFVKHTKIPYFLSHFVYLKNLKDDEILKKIDFYLRNCSTLDNLEEHYIFVLALFYSLNQRKTLKSDEYYIAKFMFHYLEFDYYLDYLKEIKNKINPRFYSASIKNIINDDIINTLYQVEGINTLKDYVEASPMYQVIPFILDEKNIDTLFNAVEFNLENRLCAMYTKQFDMLTPREEKLIKLKHGLEDNKVRTLEECGQIYNVTRERIRQMLLHSNKRLLLHLKSTHNFVSLHEDLIRFILSNKKYAFIDLLDNDLFNNDFVKNSFCHFCSILNLCNYEDKYNLIYNNNCTIDEIINESRETLPSFYTKNEFNLFKPRYQEFLLNVYRQNDNIYVKKGFSISRMVKRILDTKFNGVFTFDDQNIELLKKEYCNEYLVDSNEISDRSLRGIIERIEYFPIGGSKFQSIELFPIIPDSLLEDITKYIDNQTSPIAYKVLFDLFKKELTDLGFDNPYYLKSALDYLIGEDYNTSKFYISTKDQTVSGKQFALETLRKMNGIFDKRDVKEKLPNYTNISLDFLVASEIQHNNLLVLNNKKFIYLKNVDISDNDKTILKNIIDNTLVSNNNIITGNKVFIELYYSSPEFLDDNPLFNNAFSLFSLIKGLYSNDYNFSRPFISDKTKSDMTIYKYLQGKVENKKEVTFKDLRIYLDDLNLSHQSSRIDYVEMLSDSFVIVSDTTLVNKNQMQLSDYEINEIKLLIDLLINREDVIDTTTFKGYSVLPMLKYEWNKYLLYGMIQAYMNDYFEIYDVDAYTMDYKVRRLANGK